MKRHGFSGQPASHGNSLTHRAMGSAGQSQGGGSRVLPGKRMAGRMGGQYVTVQNKEVLKVDEELGIVLVKGECRGIGLLANANVYQVPLLDQRAVWCIFKMPSRSPRPQSCLQRESLKRLLRRKMDSNYLYHNRFVLEL